MSVKIRSSAVLSSIPLTPMIDVVFLLLIFFLVATRLEQEERELDLQLPSASEARPLVFKPKDIELSINRSGQYSLQPGQAIGLAELEAALSRAAVDNPLTQTVVIRADRECSWNHVAQALNVCYRAGLRDVKSSVADQ